MKPSLPSTLSLAIAPWSKYQHGMTMVISTVFLVILTVIGLSAMNVSNLELKMSGNAQDNYRAFNQAESARVLAEEDVQKIAKDMKGNPALFPNSNGYYNATQGEKPNPGVNFASFWTASANYTSKGFVVEYLGTQDVTLDDKRGTSDMELMNVFRITALGNGQNGATSALQTLYMEKAN